MSIKNKSEAKQIIREKLPAEQAANFLKGRQYLMFLSIDQKSSIVIERLNEIFNHDNELIEKMVKIYNELANTFFNTTERVNSYKSVSGQQSLLGLLTDGESHLKIYPKVNFNS